jgi:tetratricopeptide (TPR) repeat protein
MKIFSFLVILLVTAGASRQLQGRDVPLRVDNPATAVNAANHATDLANKGDLDGAIHYYAAAIKFDPHMYLAIYERGSVYARQHKWERAIADYNAALIVCPSFVLAAIDRAKTNGYLGRYDKALAELAQLINLRLRLHADALAHTTRAWIYATCSNPAFRNGKQAVEDAKRACRIDSWDNWDYIDTLAAAYAEAGDFDNAIKFEKEAISKAGDTDGVKDAQGRLALYQQRRPFHLAPPKTSAG